MKPAPFRYFAPTTVDEVVSLLAEHGEEAKVIAGGQSLVPMLAFRLATPPVLIDLNGVSALDHAGLTGDVLVLGALTRHRWVLDAPQVQARCPMVTDGASLIGHPAIRNRGTVAGSLAHADPAAEWPGVFLALDGEVDAVGPGGRRTIGAAGFFQTYFTTSLQPDEVLVEVRLPLPPAGATGSAFVEFARRHGDFALAGAGAVLRLGPGGEVAEARVALIGLRDTPVRAGRTESILQGALPTAEVFREAAAAAGDDIAPMPDVQGSAEYRRRLAPVVTRRALSLALARAGEAADG